MLRDRQTQQYLITAAIILPLLALLYYVDVRIREQVFVVQETHGAGYEQILLLRRNGTYEQFQRRRDNGNLTYTRGNWRQASGKQDTLFIYTGDNVDNYIVLSVKGQTPQYVLKSFFLQPTPRTQEKIEQWRKDVVLEEYRRAL